MKCTRKTEGAKRELQIGVIEDVELWLIDDEIEDLFRLRIKDESIVIPHSQLAAISALFQFQFGSVGNTIRERFKALNEGKLDQFIQKEIGRAHV